MSFCLHPRWKWGALAPWMILPRGHSYPGHRNCHQLLTAVNKKKQSVKKKNKNEATTSLAIWELSIQAGTPLHNMPIIYAGWQINDAGRTGEIRRWKKFVQSCMMSYREKENWKLASLEWQPSRIHYFKPFSYCFTSQFHRSRPSNQRQSLLKMS